MSTQTEFDGHAYQQASAHQTEWGSSLIADLGLRGDERVLDLGCGDGRLTAEIAKRVPRGAVLGMDSAAGMIRAAARHAATNLSFRRQAIEQLDEAGKWDVVFSNATLHWLHDHVDLLGRVRAAVRPGGLVRLNFAADGNSGTLVRTLRSAMAEEAFKRPFHGFKWPWFMPTIDEYSSLVSQAGFAESDVWGENADRTLESEEALIGWLDQPCLIPFLRHLSPALRGSFRDLVISRVRVAMTQPDGSLFETFRRVNVRARR